AEQAHAEVAESVEKLGGAEVCEYTVSIFEIHHVVVPGVAQFCARLTPTFATGLEGMPLEVPVGDVQHMHVLLNNDVAGERLVEQPIAQPGGFGARCGLGRETAGVIEELTAYRVADEPF